VGEVVRILIGPDGDGGVETGRSKRDLQEKQGHAAADLELSTGRVDDW
jgi:hypothetical protein